MTDNEIQVLIDEYNHVYTKSVKEFILKQIKAIEGIDFVLSKTNGQIIGWKHVMSKAEITQTMANKYSALMTALSECETFATEHNLCFDSPIDVYGMGGTFTKSGWSSSSSEC